MSRSSAVGVSIFSSLFFLFVFPSIMGELGEKKELLTPMESCSSTEEFGKLLAMV